MGQCQLGPSPDYVPNQYGAKEIMSGEFSIPPKLKFPFPFFGDLNVPILGPFFTLTLVHKTPI